jgi:hypothetical protein
MIRKLARILAALAVLAAVGSATAPDSASASTKICYRCTGGWCCYLM